MKTLFLMSLLVLFFVPLLFIWHSVYKDGIFGRIALCGLSFFSGVFLLREFADGFQYSPHPETVGLVTSFAVFIVWHLGRFEKRHRTDKKAKEGAIDRRRLLT